MTREDEYKLLISSYYGIQEMDEYSLKVYVMRDIENYIREFVKRKPILNFDYQNEAEKINKFVSLKTKLQDALLVLPKVKAPLELELMVKQKIKKMKNDI